MPRSASVNPAAPAAVGGEGSGDGIDAGALPGTPTSPSLNEPPRELERGIASWYGPGFHGRRTANGERFDMRNLTAAHKTLPFGTRVRVRNLLTGKEVEVRINDRGPFTKGRVIDLSRAAAEALGMMSLGVKQVTLQIVESASPVGNFFRAAKVR